MHQQKQMYLISALEGFLNRLSATDKSQRTVRKKASLFLQLNPVFPFLLSSKQYTFSVIQLNFGTSYRQASEMEK